MATKQQLIDWFSDGLAATGEKFAALINSLKGMQTAVSSPTTSGSSVAFIDSISQNEEGVITATKKSVSFSGYQTTAGMINYQDNDLQQVDDITVGAGDSQTINHNMKHYPTVRLMDAKTGEEVKVTEYDVKHADNMTLDIILGGSLTDTYKYILD